MALFKILRGDSSRLSSAALNDGFAYFTPDNGRFYIDVALANPPINLPVIKSGNVNGQTIYRLELRPSIAEQAVLANRATADANGNDIRTTYIADLSFDAASGVLTITNGGNQETTITIPVPPTIQIKS